MTNLLSALSGFAIFWWGYWQGKRHTVRHLRARDEALRGDLHLATSARACGFVSLDEVHGDIDAMLGGSPVPEARVHT